MEAKRIMRLLGKILMVLFLASMTIITIYPVAYALLGSLKTNMELVLGKSFLPGKLHFENFVYAFQKARFADYTINSIILCLLTTTFAIFMSTLTGYCLARHEFPGKKLLMSLYLSMMFIAVGAVSLYPQYMLMHKLGLTGSLFGLAIVLTGAQTTNTFLVMGFIKSVPKELDESAVIDGSSAFRVYAQIILPVIRPIIAVVALFTFRGTWNDYLTSLVFTMSAKKLQPLTVAVVGLRYSANAAAEWHIMAAGATIALMPVLIIYIFTNKQFISGLTAGSVKG